jgi:hypothetical protein
MKRLPDTMPRPGRTDKMLHKTPARLFRLGLIFTLTAYALTVNAQNPPAPGEAVQCEGHAHLLSDRPRGEDRRQRHPDEKTERCD